MIILSKNIFVYNWPYIFSVIFFCDPFKIIFHIIYGMLTINLVNTDLIIYLKSTSQVVTLIMVSRSTIKFDLVSIIFIQYIQHSWGKSLDISNNENIASFLFWIHHSLIWNIFWMWRHFFLWLDCFKRVLMSIWLYCLWSIYMNLRFNIDFAIIA